MVLKEATAKEKKSRPVGPGCGKKSCVANVSMVSMSAASAATSGNTSQLDDGRIFFILLQCVARVEGDLPGFAIMADLVKKMHEMRPGKRPVVKVMQEAEKTQDVFTSKTVVFDIKILSKRSRTQERQPKKFTTT